MLDIGTLAGYLDLDTEKFDKGLEGVGDKMGKLGPIAVAGGAVAGAALAYGLTSAMDLEQANAKLSAQLGLTAEQSKAFGKAAGDLYANNYGDSLDQVNEALKGVQQNVGDLMGNSDTALEDVTSKVLNLSSAFGTDLSMSTQAVGTIMRTGLAKDADEALDVLTVGLQNGANKADDLLETFQEYSTEFRSIGLSAADATGLISQGLKAGARDADTVADALKEFKIRGQDASTTSAAGFKLLGLNAKAMTKAVAEGGPKARDALDQVLDRMRGMTDPVKRNAAAVDLFGTKAEDLGNSLFALDPTTAVDSLGKVAGAADKMGKTLSDTAAAKIETLKRKALMGLTRFVGGELLPGLERFVDWVSANFGPIWDEVSAAVERNWPPIQQIIETVVARVEAVVGELMAAFHSHSGRFGEFATKAQEMARNVLDALSSGFAAVQVLVETVVKIITDLWDRFGQDIVDALVTHITAVVGVLNGVFEIISGLFDLITAILTGKWGDAWDAVKEILGGAVDVILSLVRLVMNEINMIIQVGLGLVSAVWSFVWNAMSTFLSDTVGRLLGWLRDHWQLIAAILTGPIGLAVLVIARHWDTIKSGVSAVKQWISDRFGDIVGFITGMPARIGKAAAGMWDGIKNAFRSMINAVVGFWNGLKFTTPAIDFDPPGPGSIHISGKTFGVPQIPRVHTGGLAGDELFAILQRGERVLARNDPINQALGAPGALATGAGAGLGAGVTIHELHLQTDDPPRRWLDEASWRLAS